MNDRRILRAAAAEAAAGEDPAVACSRALLEAVSAAHSIRGGTQLLPTLTLPFAAGLSSSSPRPSIRGGTQLLTSPFHSRRGTDQLTGRGLLGRGASPPYIIISGLPSTDALDRSLN